jgi:aminopeptidase N
MKEGQPQEIRLAEYRAPEFTTESVDLTFDIQEGATVVTSRLQLVRLDPTAERVTLDGQDLELLRVSVDGRELTGNEYQQDDESLTIHGLGARSEIVIETRIKPEDNTALEGLYRSSNMYCTQCEAEGFRKITYYQDRPDVLAKFTTTIIADGSRYPTLLSNGNLVSEADADAGRRSVTWEDPFPKPSYLFALVAGNLQMIEDKFTTMSGREVTLQIFSEAHNIEQCHYAMDVLKRSMTWDEQRFGREYDLDVFMIVAVEDFNMGAMENKGLNIFNTSCVLASPDTASDAAYLRVEAVVAHEYFHNWSGNRVTCRDWFQLSLKEGFTVFRDAEFSSDMNSRPVKRIEDVAFLRAVQFAEDSGPLAHPVRPQSYIEISNFYTTTIYEKGAEVVRMYHTLLGDEKFRAATDLYFDRHDGSAATTDDFTAVMAEVGGQDLSQFKLWYDQAGTPLIEVGEVFDDGEFSLVIQQTCPATPNQDNKLPFHVPVELGLLDQEGDALSLYDLVIDAECEFETRHGGGTLLLSVRAPTTVVKFSYLESKPVVSFLRNFSAPVRVAYARQQRELAFLAEHDTDGFVKWDALQSLWLDWFSDAVNLEGVDLVATIGELANQALKMGDDAERKLLAATMLTVPDENYLFEELDVFEVDSLLDARESVLDDLARTHLQRWIDMYETYRCATAYEPTAGGMADRCLSNIAFDYAARTMRGGDLGEFVQQHYHGADNLTDRLAALRVVCRHAYLDEGVRESLLGDFYQRWQDEALVVDLWFNMQAQSPLSTIEGLSALQSHEKFDLKNPNRARSLFSAFGTYNNRRMHALDGSGYRFLADAVARMDTFNPQMAARIVTPLTRWQRYDERRQALMRAQLETLVAAQDVSKDLYEIVTKSVG